MTSWERTRTLLREAQDGRREAFDGIVAEYTDFVGSFIRSQVGKQMRQKTEVEDLVQETFLRAFLAIKQFRGRDERAFRGWLRTIADHAVADQGRRQRIHGRAGAREVPLERGASGEGGEAGGPLFALRAKDISPSKVLGRDERFDRLKEAMSILSPDHRRVIFLARVRCLPIKEIARRMKRSPDAVSMLLLRATLKLKTAFGSTESLHLPHQRSLEEEGGVHE